MRHLSVPERAAAGQWLTAVVAELTAPGTYKPPVTACPYAVLAVDRGVEGTLPPVDVPILSGSICEGGST